MNTSRPELGARLDHLCLQSPDPERLARFFERGFSMPASRLGERWQCQAPARHVLIEAGLANKTAFFAYSFASSAALSTFKASLVRRDVAMIANPSPFFDAAAFAVNDPDGNVVVFGVRCSACSAPQAATKRSPPGCNTSSFAARISMRWCSSIANRSHSPCLTA
ncbi:MAG: hypothetical protein EXR39_07685 [Betaproteobacteria bacterium]|nr:hypothetical protein [Betaproteobacteria bacterium]